MSTGLFLAARLAEWVGHPCFPWRGKAFWRAAVSCLRGIGRLLVPAQSATARNTNTRAHVIEAAGETRKSANLVISG